MLHIQGLGPNAYFAVLAKQARGLPIVLTDHGEYGSEVVDGPRRRRLTDQMLADVLNMTDVLSATSRYALHSLEQASGRVFGNPALIIPNGIHLDEINVGDSYLHPRPYVLAAGKLDCQRGHDALIKAMSLIFPATHDLLVIGEGSERAALEELSYVTGLKRRAKFVGEVDRETRTALFKGCSVYATAARFDPDVTYALEAMAAAKAVVATDVGGIAEVVTHAQTGVIVVSGDVNALCEPLARLMVDDDLRHRLGELGRQRAQSMDWCSIADRYLLAYRAASQKAAA
jgi:glycosyltransferase involved in cell wall biosynthesis